MRSPPDASATLHPRFCSSVAPLRRTIERPAMIFRSDVDRAVVPASLQRAGPASANGCRRAAICRAKSCQEKTFVSSRSWETARPMSPPHISFKYWCTNATAIAPSPTAEATTHERRATGQVGHVAGELAELDELVAGPVVFERRSGAAPERGVLPVWRRLHPSGRERMQHVDRPADVRRRPRSHRQGGSRRLESARVKLSKCLRSSRR